MATQGTPGQTSPIGGWTPPFILFPLPPRPMHHHRQQVHPARPNSQQPRQQRTNRAHPATKTMPPSRRSLRPIRFLPPNYPSAGIVFSVALSTQVGMVHYRNISVTDSCWYVLSTFSARTFVSSSRTFVSSSVLARPTGMLARPRRIS